MANTPNPSGMVKVFNDPVHGHIEFPSLVIRIIDTPQFQRLRYIKQLGGKYYVYPGASHNRFEHSIGVAYLAGCLAKELRSKQPELGIDDRDILCVQIAGLCHDLGHGPFSHLFEEFMHQAAPQKNFKHEEASVKMLDHLIESNNLKSVMEKYLTLPDDLTFIKEMIGGPPKNKSHQSRKEKTFLYEIVANKNSGIDVDKMDYFARDCHHLGMQNNFDHKRFIAFARVCKDKETEETHICIRDKEVWNMYDLFYTRFCLHHRAYQHRVARVIEIMITDALLKANEYIKIEGSGGDYFTISGSVDDMVAYTKLTDNIFQHILHSTSGQYDAARNILEKIERRELYQLVGQTQPKPISDDYKGLTKEMYQVTLKEIIQKTGEAETQATNEDFRLDVINMDYGKKVMDPVASMWFYRKSNPNDTLKISKEEVSCVLPQKFKEQIIFVYYTEKCEMTLDAATDRFKKWCMEKGLKCQNFQ